MNKVKLAIGMVALLSVTACAPSIPESGPGFDGRPVDTGGGVGFGDYEAYEQARIARDRQLGGGTTPVLTPAPPAPGANSTGGGAVISSEELSAAGLPSSGSTAGTQAQAAPPPAATNTGPVAVDVNNPGISDEQDFKAVASRETIQSDRQRLEAQAEAYRVIQPTAVPTRAGQSGPNIVEFALKTSNRVGEKLYSRSSFGAEGRFLRACAAYASSDLAQEAFLKKGGPEKDRDGLDPDGDGFACYWDPAPYRKVRG